MKLLSFHTAGLLADSINDASSTRKVYLLAAGLAVLGIALVVITVWFWRSTRHDPELLAPLEAMGARRFKRLDGGSQQQVLNRSRPADAKPRRWGVLRGEASGDSEIDLLASLRDAPAGYDDLRDPALIAVALEEPGEEVEPATSPALPATSGSDEAKPLVAATPAPALDPLADIDALLAAAGATLAGTGAPVAGRTDQSADKPADQSAEAIEPAAEPDVVVPAADSDAAPVRPTIDEPAVPAAMVAGDRPRGSKPGVRPAESTGVPPLVIVPVDHELRPSRTAAAAPEAAPESVDVTAAAELPEADEESVSIDPLLRMFKRNDG